MQSIGPGAHHSHRNLTGSPDNSGGLVLPRLLRKPARHVRRLLNGGFRVSRKGLALSALTLAMLTGAAAFVSNGGNDAVMARLAPSLGISIKAFDVSGNREVSEIEIVRLVSTGEANSILEFNVKEARDALKQHPWIADARVSRVYPDRLAIEVSERKPFALWQSEDGLKIIDREGQVLSDYDGRDDALPLLVGRGAESNAAGFVDLMAKYPAIASMAKAYVKVGERRWDIELENGTTIMLPEQNVEREIERLVSLDRDKELLARDIDRIDLRLEDRVVLRVSPEARQAIEEKRQEQLKLLASSSRERNT